MNKSQKLLMLSACLLSTALLPGCPGEGNEADVEACEHLQKGPSTAVTATATASGAPAVDNDHRRYDITLVQVDGGKGGRVTFAADEVSDHVFFTSADVPFKVLNSSNMEVAIEESAKSSTECTEVKGRFIVPLTVGTYTLSFGPTTVDSVSLVIEQIAHEDH